MALSRNSISEWLSGAGVAEDKINGVTDKIIKGHAMTVNALQEKIDDLQKEADKVPTLTKERDDAQKLVKDGEGWKDKFETLQKQQQQTLKKSLLSDALKEAGANASVINLMLKGADLEKIELDDSGKMKDAKKIVDAYKAESPDLFATEEKHGAEIETPPAGGKRGKKTLEEIQKITDREEQRKAIAENIELFERE